MKEILTNIIAAAILAVGALAVITLGCAIPSIMSWLANYIGEPMTWILFLSTMFGICYACVKLGNNR